VLPGSRRPVSLVGVAVAAEPVLTPGETARRVKQAVIHVGAAFGHEAAFADAGQRFGLDWWAFYFGARAGVLGPVDADVVVAACGFFAPALVGPAWDSALSAASPGELVAADVGLCVAWARRRLASLPGIDRLAELAGRVVDAADASERPLFAAWRALPDPAADPAARAGLALLRLREHRGSGHLLAVAAEGLTPLEAILAGPGPAKAAANGWRPPYPPAGDAARLLAAERRTGELAGVPYACLDAGERRELVDLAQAAYELDTTHIEKYCDPPP
jgi:hypothetical protein